MARRIWITGHAGLLGTALVERFANDDLILRTRAELELMDDAAVYKHIHDAKPDIVIHAAAKVGGPSQIAADPAPYLLENAITTSNVIGNAVDLGVPQFVFVGSGACYSADSREPLAESDLEFAENLEPTLEPYVRAKRVGIAAISRFSRLKEFDYFSILPSNLYGPCERLDPELSGVLPALMLRFHRALPKKPVSVWGTGAPVRDFLHTADCAEAIHRLLEVDKAQRGDRVNVATGASTSIRDLAHMIQATVGHKGEIQFDSAKPDGFASRRLDVGKLQSFGWQPKHDLGGGLRHFYDWLKTSRFA